MNFRMETPLHRARMRVPRDRLDELMERLAVLEPAPTAWEDVESGEAWIETYDCDGTACADRACAMARIAEDVDGRVHAATLETVPATDWTEAWKRFFHATRVAPRIVVRPAWEPFDPAPGDIVVTIDPGLSFGTGLHPTTRACLAFLDRLTTADAETAARRAVDLGCGSGILAIAAAKLGYGSVVALDHDPLAVRVTLENLALNALEPGRVRAVVADVLAGAALPAGDLVFANILAPVLVEAAPRIARALRRGPHAALVLAGVLEAQFAEVAAAYAREGLHVAEETCAAGWRTGLLRSARA